jgi:phosphate-selective porin
MLSHIFVLMMLCPPDAVNVDTRGDAAPPAQVETCGSLDVEHTDPKPKKRRKDDTPPRPSFRFGSAVRLDFDASFLGDALASESTATSLDSFELHRARIAVKGKVLERVEFEVERELTTNDVDLLYLPKSPWKDVFVNVTAVRNLQVQAGKFKIPFGLDETTGILHNDFAYRSLGASYLAPARDIGAMAHGRFFKRGLSYWAGAFVHDGENARSKKIRGGDRTVAARIAGKPLRPLGVKGLELGTAFAFSGLSDDWFEPNGLRGRTVISEDTFFHAVYVKGHRRRWEADADWTAGPAWARGEFTWVSDDRLGQGLREEDLPEARARSWYVSGGWTLTGERKRRPFKADVDALRHAWGAVELVGRYERLRFDSATAAGAGGPSPNPRAETILPSGDEVFTAGVNWFVNRRIKVQVNGIREHVEDAEHSPMPAGAAFWSSVVRLQFEL